MIRLGLAGVVIASVFVPSGGSASAAGETCDGVPATVVGSSGSILFGTPGPDVIVTNGAVNVGAGAGDDLICITGTMQPADPLYRIQVLGEAGNDVIDRRGDAGWSADVTIDPGPGQDQVLGSPGREIVFAQDGERDSISTFAGDDYVSSSANGASSVSDPEAVDMGAGNDYFDAGRAFAGALSLTGGEGVDGALRLPPAPGHVRAGRGSR